MVSAPERTVENQVRRNLPRELQLQGFRTHRRPAFIASFPESSESDPRPGRFIEITHIAAKAHLPAFAVTRREESARRIAKRIATFETRKPFLIGRVKHSLIARV